MPKPKPDSEYHASRPAGVPVSMLHYTLHFPRYAFSFWGRLFLVFVFAAVAIHALVVGHEKGWGGFIIASYIAYGLMTDRKNIKGRFVYGDLCPGVVVSLKPPLIAVATDLRKTTREHHFAVRVLQHRLWKRDMPDLTVGSRVATACSYYGTYEDSWETFEPEPIHYGMGNADDVEFITKQIPEEDWDELFVLLSQVPEPYRPGLYRLKSPCTDAV